MHDLKFTLRSLTRSKGFAIAVILTLGLGIGANTAIFSVINAVMLKPLPHRDGDRLMYLRQSADGPGHENVAFSVPEINDFRQMSKTLGGIAEYSPITMTMVTDNSAERIDLGLVTGNYFSVMGLAPIRGRAFDAKDDGPGAAPVVMLTHEYWQSRFGGDTSIVGKTLRIGGKPVLVVGILQAAPYFPAKIDALGNMVNSEHHVSATMVQGRTHRMTEMIARLAPGATVEQARSDVASVTKKMYGDHPETYDAGSHYKVTLTPFKEVLGQKARLTLWLLMGAAAFVLIIACANVANLTLMRGVRREQELVVRAALGSGVARLRKLLLVENLVLALAGGVLGIVIAIAGVKLLADFAARYSTRANEISINGVVLAFALLLSVVVAVLLAFAPKLAHENTLGVALTSNRRGSTGGMNRQRLQGGLVVAQIAVSVVLLTGAGLLIRTMQHLAETDTGLRGGDAMTMELPGDFTNPDRNGQVAKYERIRREVAALPGVTDVGLGSTVPLRLNGFQLPVKAEDRPQDPSKPFPQSEYRTATPGYFKTSGVPLLEGRDFTDNDKADAAPVVILNKTAAQMLFGDVDPIGRRVSWTGDVLRFIGMKETWMTIVGVVGDTKDGGLDAAAFPVVFAPFNQGIYPSGGLVIRGAGDITKLAPAATKVVHRIDPKQPVEHVMTISQIKDESVGPRRLNAQLVAAFGLLALIIAAIGIAGVLAFSVSSRTNEIGIRMSLGADTFKVQRMILSEGGLLLVLGLVIGVGGAWTLAKLIQGLLFGVPPHDPVTIVAVLVTMALVGVGACWIPAIRAARIDPADALRAQ